MPVAVITGASAGVGRAVTRLLAREGWSLALVARGREGLEGARREAEAQGARVMTFPVDVADAQAVEGAAAEAEIGLGPIDVWINNAMVSVFSPVRLMLAEEFRRVTEVSYLGYVHGTLAALRRMRIRDRGLIVQVGSALAYRAIPLQSAYCAAKHAVEGFTESLRCELLHDGSGVRVTIVELPAMNTPQFTWSRSRMPRRAQPVPPLYRPEVGAEAIVRAIHHPRRELLVAPPTWIAVIGNRLFPALFDRILAIRGYEAQMTGEPERPRADNLWAPLPGDAGAEGPFTDIALERSSQAWFRTLLGWLRDLVRSFFSRPLRVRP